MRKTNAGLLAVLAIVAIYLVFGGVGSKVSRKPELGDLGQESRLRPIPENPAPQVPGPDLPAPLLPGDSALSGEGRKGQYPASPADPHQYTAGWERELATVEGVNKPVVVIWGNSIFVGYKPGNAAKQKVQAGVERRIRALEPQFREIIVTGRARDLEVLQSIAAEIKRGSSAGLHAGELESIRQRAAKSYP